MTTTIWQATNGRTLAIPRKDADEIRSWLEDEMAHWLTMSRHWAMRLAKVDHPVDVTITREFLLHAAEMLEACEELWPKYEDC